jgi:hypothetical protein
VDQTDIGGFSRKQPEIAIGQGLSWTKTAREEMIVRGVWVRDFDEGLSRKLEKQISFIDSGDTLKGKEF